MVRAVYDTIKLPTFSPQSKLLPLLLLLKVLRISYTWKNFLLFQLNYCKFPYSPVSLGTFWLEFSEETIVLFISLFSHLFCTFPRKNSVVWGYARNVFTLNKKRMGKTLITFLILIRYFSLLKFHFLFRTKLKVEITSCRPSITTSTGVE